ncbi:hypothetical protein NG791_06695, partial [Laspinema sp. D1]|uniref:hypothetical protein n=1 Tax=Laspinema palackyanum TaxID=3231601 RepID=UPI00347C6644|nr:hypothetical protein [Laspinema sp. D2b]
MVVSSPGRSLFSKNHLENERRSDPLQSKDGANLLRAIGLTTLLSINSSKNFYLKTLVGQGFQTFFKKSQKNPQKRLTNPGGLVKVVKRGEERQRTS